MRNRLVFCVIAISFLASCQKELTNEGLPEFCAVTSIKVTDGTTNAITAMYTFEYDSFLLKPSKLKYENFPKGISRTLSPTYAGDSIYLGARGFITLDNSGKISILNETNSFPGIENGDYYYTYNNVGRMEQKLLDDGVDDASRTNFTYNNDTLVSYKQDIPGYVQGLSASLTYSNTLQVKAFPELATLEIFPELMLYMPCIKLGKLTSAPLAQIISTKATSGSETNTTTTYSNYTLTQEGWLSSFETSTVVDGQKAVKTVYNFEYQCIK